MTRYQIGNRVLTPYGEIGTVSEIDREPRRDRWDRLDRLHRYYVESQKSGSPVVWWYARQLRKAEIPTLTHEDERTLHETR